MLAKSIFTSLGGYLYMSESDNTSKQDKKSTLPPEVKYLNLVKTVQSVSKKLMNMSANHRTAAYWEQIVEDCDEILKRNPLS